MKDKGGDRLATKGGSIDKTQKKGWSRKKQNKNRKNKKASSFVAAKNEEAANTVVALPSRDKPTNSNWEKMRAGLSSGKKKRKARPSRDAKGESLKDDKFSPTAKRENKQETRIVAVDCEMVGVGESGSKSALARVVVINYYGNVLIDTHCLPKERVTDYRTRVSGIRPADLKGAPDFDHVQRKVALLLRGKVVVGHALKNDFKALKLKHPKQDVRDTSSYTPLRQAKSDDSNSAQLMNDMWRGFTSNNISNSNDTAERSGGEDATANNDSSSTINSSERKFKSRALKELAAEHLGLEIQHGEHSPVEDARAALYLYHKHRIMWERSLNGQKNTKKTFIKDVVSNKTGTSEDSKKTPPTSSREGGDNKKNMKQQQQQNSNKGKKSHRDEDRVSAGGGADGANEDEGYGIGLISSE